MQSSTPFSNSSTTQEERPNDADDGRHRGNEEVSTISEGNISVPEDQHVKTIRNVHDFIPQPSKRRGLRKLSQFPEKVCKVKKHYAIMKLFEICATSSDLYTFAHVGLLRYFTSFDYISTPLINTIRSS